MKTIRRQISRILCLALAVACMLSLFSCDFINGILKKGEDETDNVAAIAEIVANAKPTRIITFVDYTVGEETLKGRYTTEYDRANDKGKFEFSYQRIAIPGESISATSVETISGTVVMKDGQFSYDDCETWEGGGLGYLEYSLDISKDKLAEYTVSKDGKTLTAKVAASDAKRVFGTAISAEGDIDLTVVTSGTDLYSVSIKYTTTTGALVTIETSYESLDITLDY